MSIRRLQEMFERVVIDKDAEAIPDFYDSDFLLHTNGVTQDYEAFLAEHIKIYKTAIRYAVEYDSDAWVEGAGRVAGRMWITTTRPAEPGTRIEVILVATFRENRIHRLWEITWPNWAELPAFENYTT